MRRVLIIGSPGAGKSTLSFELARRTGLPLIHLDQHAWLPGWVELGRDKWKAKVRELVAGDEWVIDGNYGGSLTYRLTRADTVIDLDLPMWLCVARLVKRIVSTHGRVRADMADGCPEQLDWGFLLTRRASHGLIGPRSTNGWPPSRARSFGSKARPRFAASWQISRRTAKGPPIP